MQLKEYQRRAQKTDQRRNLRLSILGLVGEVGSIVSTFKKKLRDRAGFTAFDRQMKEELGDTLWYLSSVSSLLDFDLEEIAERNLQKTQSRWEEGEPQFFDKDFDEDEQLPRQLDIIFKEKVIGKSVYVKLQTNGVFIGDRLTDNAYDEDGYRYHDAFHLGYAAVLGWSPVLRGLLKRKRKRNPQIDEVEDGARAQIIEEAIAIHIFNYARDHNFFEKIDVIDNDLLQTVQGLCRGLEVQACTTKQWERAILAGYAVFRELKRNCGGVVAVDMDKCEIRYVRSGTSSATGSNEAK